MAIFSNSCFVALGTGAPAGRLTELTGGSYVRQALSLTGSFQSGAIQALAAFGAAAGPTTTALTAVTPTQIRSAAIFDASTGGNQLCHWGWSPPWSQTLITTAFPAVTLQLTMIGTISASFQTFSGAITPGELLGAMNGNPLITSANLLIVNGVFTASTSASTSAALTAVLNTLASMPSYANDAAAAVGGVTIGGPTGVYRNGNIVQVRVT